MGMPGRGAAWAPCRERLQRRRAACKGQARGISTAAGRASGQLGQCGQVKGTGLAGLGHAAAARWGAASRRAGVAGVAGQAMTRKIRMMSTRMRKPMIAIWPLAPAFCSTYSTFFCGRQARRACHGCEPGVAARRALQPGRCGPGPPAPARPRCAWTCPPPPGPARPAAAPARAAPAPSPCPAALSAPRGGSAGPGPGPAACGGRAARAGR